MSIVRDKNAFLIVDQKYYTLTFEGLSNINLKKMLNKLFSSKTRVKLLKLFLFNPEKQFFVRELTRVLGEHLNSIRRELSNLEEMGFIKCVDATKHKNQIIDKDEIEDIDEKDDSKSISKIQKKYYQVSENFSLYNELKALFLKAEVISEDEIRQKIDKIDGIEYFILTGSFTNSISPTDLFIVGTFDQSKLLDLIKELEVVVKKELNYTVMNQEEFLHRLNLVDNFLYRILECSKLVIKDEISKTLNPYISQHLVKNKN